MKVEQKLRLGRWLHAWLRVVDRLQPSDLGVVEYTVMAIRDGRASPVESGSFCEFGPGITPEVVIALAARSGEHVWDVLVDLAKEFAPELHAAYLKEIREGVNQKATERIDCMEGYALRWLASHIVRLQKMFGESGEGDVDFDCVS